MKSSVFCSLILCFADSRGTSNAQKAPQAGPSVVAATEQKARDNQKEIDAILAELKAISPQEADIPAKLTTLDKSDADLKKSIRPRSTPARWWKRSLTGSRMRPCLHYKRAPMPGMLSAKTTSIADAPLKAGACR